MTAPANKVQVQGQTVFSGDNANTGVQWTTNAESLRAFIGLTGMTVYLQGIVSPDDGGQGEFFWEATVSQPDDNLNYIIPPGASGGGWVRVGPTLPIPIITGALSAVADVNAQAVLTSIIAALVTQGIATDGTS